MKTYRRAHDNAAQTADNDAQASSTNIIPLRGANSEKTKQDPSILRLPPGRQAVELPHDLIAERARAIWLERGCSLDQDEENWREAEAQLKTEMGIEYSDTSDLSPSSLGKQQDRAGREAEGEYSPLSQDVIIVDLLRELEKHNELQTVRGMLRDRGDCDIVVDFSHVDVVGGACLAGLLEVRRLLNDRGHRLTLCNVAPGTKGAIPLLIVEMVKVVRYAQRKG